MRPTSTLFALLCTAALCACGREVVEKPDGGDDGIAFATRLGAPDGATRGASVESPAALAAEGGFDVWALSHSTTWASNPAKTSILDGTRVTGTVTDANVEWSYGTPAKWPGEEYVSFFAYAPGGAATLGTPTAEKVPTLAFEVAADVKQQKDLMIATPVYDRTIDDYSDGKAPVELMFGHALSRIVLSGVAVDAVGQNIKVKSVEIDGLYSQGTIALDAAPVVWNVTGSPAASYSLSIAGGELADVQLMTTSQNIITEQGYLFVMPQSLAREPGPSVTMNISLEMGDEKDIRTTTMFYPDEWLPGKSYNYQLVVEGFRVNLVLVSIDDLTVTEWKVEKMIQPVPLTDDRDRDENRLRAAIDGLGYLNTSDDPDIPSMRDDCDDFVIYMMNSLNHDIVINMADYNDMFTAGERLTFHGEKLLESWNPIYSFTVTFDGGVWTQLTDANSNPMTKPDILVLERKP